MNDSAKRRQPISRRRFARDGALAAASAACLPLAITAEASSQTLAQEPALSTASQAEVDAKVAAVLRHYGQLLSDEQKLEIRRLLTEGQKPLDEMRMFAILNLDDPDQPADVLRLYPEAAQAAPIPQKSGKK